MSPITWFSTAMHHGDDQNVVRLDCVQDSVRKDVSKATMDVFFDDSPARWRFSDFQDCLLYGIDES